MIPYGHQTIDESDIAAVVNVLRSAWLTQGPAVTEFERALAAYCGARFAVVASSGTAALQAAYSAAGLGAGDEMITTPLTFAATANAAVWLGAKPVFVDIEARTGNIDPEKIQAAITARTRVIAPLDYTGRPAELETIGALAKEKGLVVVEDGCHALGGSYRGRRIGSISDLTVFSFHPVKAITTGEGGAVLTNNETFYKHLKKYVTHGMERAELVHESPGAWYHEMQFLAQNYRLTDIQAALGVSQLKKLDQFVAARCWLAERYTAALAGNPALITPPADTDEIKSGWHLSVVRLAGQWAARRADIFAALIAKEIGVNVHYLPVYRHPYYESLGYRAELCPKAETFYESAITLPLYPTLSETDQDYIISTLQKLVS